jgi:hypothetical protein
MAGDVRRVDNGAQMRCITELALHRGPSMDSADIGSVTSSSSTNEMGGDLPPK